MMVVALTRWSKRAYVLTRLTTTLEKGYPKPKRNVRAEFVPGNIRSDDCKKVILPGLGMRAATK